MKEIHTLLLIDIQKAFDDHAYWGGGRNNPEAEVNAARLLTHWRAQGWPVIHIQHNSVLPTSIIRPGQVGNEFKDEVAPLAGEPVFSKTVNSAWLTSLLDGTPDSVVGHCRLDHRPLRVHDYPHGG